MNLQNISQYYDSMLPFYRIRFSTSYGFHVGYYDEDTKSRKDAILNLNKLMAEKAEIKDGDLILDSGCGVGGSCLWLVDNYDVKTIGITISKKQLDVAKKLAKNSRISKKAQYYLRDYTKTGFEENMFDVIWAAESVCYATSKPDFLKESYRILKKGGRLIVADGILKRKPKDEKEKKLLVQLNNGYALENNTLQKDFEADLTRAKFKKIKYLDISKRILPGLKIPYKIFVPIATLTEKLMLTPKSLTGTLKASAALKELVKNGLVKYMIFYAEK